MLHAIQLAPSFAGRRLFIPASGPALLVNDIHLAQQVWGDSGRVTRIDLRLLLSTGWVAAARP